MAEYQENKAEKNKLRSILDLQEFLKDELHESGELLISRAFKPITDGLGLESPPKKELPFPEPPPPEKVQKVEAPPTLVEKQITSFLNTPPLEDKQEVTEAPPPAESLSEIMQVRSYYEEIQKAPPPLPEQPSAPLFKRAAAILIDQIFVLTLFALALVLTSNLMLGFKIGFSTKILQDFSNPHFIRFAILEFSAIWLGYLAICIFSMNTTFGMWVWGLKISFGDRHSENYSMRKIMRVIWSFIFCAPIVSMVFLFIRKQGKNIIDLLSGSSVSGSEA